MPTPAFLLSLLSFVVHQEAKRREMSRKEEKKSHLETMIGGSKIKLYLTGGILGCLRSIVGFPFEHPLDSMKTQWQTQPHMKNEYYVYKAYLHSLLDIQRNLAKEGIPRSLRWLYPQFITQYCQEYSTLSKHYCL